MSDRLPVDRYLRDRDYGARIDVLDDAEDAKTLEVPYDRTAVVSPILSRADFHQPSVFMPENLLREARRQKGVERMHAPPICVLDPDGDIVRHLRETGARRQTDWACYHTDMWEWQAGGTRYGIVGGAVGASFAVLIAEQLFASGCELLISIASAGTITASELAVDHVLIERAIRDEGTSYHYLPPARFARADAALVARAEAGVRLAGLHVLRGTSWTTDAPFRETASAISANRALGAVTVEMEAAALYAFAQARGKAVLCLAHVTNQLGCVDGDFEKGHDNGAQRALALVDAIAAACWSAST